MKNAPYSIEAFHWFTETGKAPEEIDVVEECGDEPFGAGGMILPGPRDLSQID